MAFRKITMDDLKDIDLTKTKGSSFDLFAATAERAREIHLEEAPQPPPKRKRERSSAAKLSDEEDDSVEAAVSDSKRKKKCNSPNWDHQQPPPPLPEEFKRVIEEMAREREATPAPAKLVIQKGLFGTDLSGGHNRLSIPMSQIADDFLTAEEREFLIGYDASKKKNYLEVRIVQPSLAPETVKFCRWDMPKKNGGKTSSSYVINGKWNSIVERNKLRVGMVVQLWCFRIDRDLCFALVRLPRN